MLDKILLCLQFLNIFQFIGIVLVVIISIIPVILLLLMITGILQPKSSDGKYEFSFLFGVISLNFLLFSCLNSITNSSFDNLSYYNNKYYSITNCVDYIKNNSNTIVNNSDFDIENLKDIKKGNYCVTFSNKTELITTISPNQYNILNKRKTELEFQELNKKNQSDSEINKKINEKKEYIENFTK